jgi:glycerophosphoryl diester phosphodiesterase
VTRRRRRRVPLAAGVIPLLLGASLLAPTSCAEEGSSPPTPSGAVAGVAPDRFFAHRGMNAFAPENTELAIGLALERDFRNVEIDVRTTRDDEIVVFHDEGLQRWTGEARSICEVSLAELQAVDPAPFYLREVLRVPADVVPRIRGVGDSWVARLSAAHIATLAEVFATFGDRLTYHLDVKRFGCTVSRPVMLGRLVGLIERAGLERHVYVESTDLAVLAMIRAMNPTIRVLYWRDDVFDASDDDLALVRELGIEAVDVASSRVVPAKRPRLAGLEVFTFTVNSVPEIKRLAGAVDFVLTDLDVASGALLSPATFFNERADRVRVYPDATHVPAELAAAGFTPVTDQPAVFIRRSSAPE